MAHIKSGGGVPPSGPQFNGDAPPDFHMINQHLANCHTAADVLQVVDKWGMYFNQINLGTALYYLGEAKARGRAVGVDLATAPQILVMANAAKEHATVLGPKQLAEVLWGLAHCGFRGDVEFFDTLAREVLQKLSDFTAAFMGCTFWGFADMGYIPGTPLLKTAADMMQANLHMFPTKACLDMMWALAKMEYVPSPQLCTAVLDQLQPQLGSITPPDMANLLWACSEFKYPAPGLEFLRACTASMLDNIGSWTMEHMATSLVAFGTFTFHPGPQLLTQVSDSMANLVPQTPLPAVIKLLKYLTSVLFHPGPAALAAVTEALAQTSLAQPLPTSHIATALLAFATFGYVPPTVGSPQPLLMNLAMQVDQQLAKMTALDAANMLWCYALFNACTPDVWQTLSNKLGSFQEEEIPVAALTRLFQVYLLMKASNGALADSTMNQYPKLLTLAGNQWKSTVLAQSQAPASELLQDIARVLSLMGVPFAAKRLTEDGTMCIDIAFVDTSVNVHFAVLACDQDHFCKNPTPQGVAAPALGSTIMQVRLLEACRLVVLSIPFYEWQFAEGNGGDKGKAEYLRNLCQKKLQMLHGAIAGPC